MDTKVGFIVSFKSRNSYKKLFLIFGKFNILKIKEHYLSLEDLFLKVFKK